MYMLAQSGNPPRRIAAGRYGEDNDATDTPRKPSPPPCFRPISLSLGVNRCHSTGDLQPTSSVAPRIVTTDIEEEVPPSRLAPSPQQQIQVKRESFANQLFIREPGSPPQTIQCNLSRASSVSEISVNEPEWIIDDSSSSSESALVRKHMVSAEDWEGIILAVSCPDHETKVSRPFLSKSTEDWPCDTCIHGSKGGQNDMKFRCHQNYCSDGGNSSGDAYCTDPMSCQGILDYTFHTQLSPPQRKPSLAPKSTVPTDTRTRNTEDRGGDLREYVVLDAKSLSGYRNNGLSADTAPNDTTFPQEPASSSHVTPSTTTTTLCPSSYEATQKPALSNNYSLSGCDGFEALPPQLKQEKASIDQEMRISGMSDDEMLRLALQASKEEYEEWKQILSALEESSVDYPGKDISNDRVNSYTLEALLALPMPQRLPEPPETQHQKNIGFLQILLRRPRGGSKSPATT
jgi:hypothetical protein